MNKKQFTTVQKLIPLANLEANPWNPNQQNEQIFKSLVNSIKENGFTSAILVRTIVPELKWQIIDGEHRWKACIELNYDTIKAEDIGIIDDLLAKTLTIALNNIRGQDDVFKRAEILKILNEGQLSLLPWTKEEIENEKALINFDWEKYDKEEAISEKQDYNICFALTKPQYIVAKHALELISKEHTEAFLAIIEDSLWVRGAMKDEFKQVFGNLKRDKT